MAVSPADVKKLRDKTLAGMLDCKKALIACDGDFAAAEKHLKEQGLASADKRSDRTTENGSVFTSVQGNVAAVAELSCETDFVAKNTIFKEGGQKIVDAIAANNSSDMTPEIDSMVKELISVLKENMSVKNVKIMELTDSDVAVPYIHGGGQIGVIVKLSCDSAETAAKDEVKALGFDLALHAAAFNPAYLNRSKVDAAYIAEQESIFKAQAEHMDKPEKVIAGIIKGKLNKHIAQICFVDQAFVKNDKLTVTQAVAEVAKTLGGSIELTDFAYAMVGGEA